MNEIHVTVHAVVGLVVATVGGIGIQAYAFRPVVDGGKLFISFVILMVGIFTCTWDPPSTPSQ